MDGRPRAPEPRFPEHVWRAYAEPSFEAPKSEGSRDPTLVLFGCGSRLGGFLFGNEFDLGQWPDTYSVNENHMAFAGSTEIEPSIPKIAILNVSSCLG
jgi:hypothetical protein